MYVLIDVVIIIIITTTLISHKKEHTINILCMCNCRAFLSLIGSPIACSSGVRKPCRPHQLDRGGIQ